MERVKQNWSHQTLRQLLGDVHNAVNLHERMIVLQQSRKQKTLYKSNITDLISLAHAHAVNLLNSSDATQSEYAAASAVAAYAGLDNEVKNTYRNGKPTSAHVYVRDMVNAIYSAADDEQKELLDMHYSDMYGVDCPQIIAQIGEPEAKHNLIPKLDAKKAATAAIGAGVIAVTTFGVTAGANAAEMPDYQLATSTQMNTLSQSYTLEFDTVIDSNGTEVDATPTQQAPVDIEDIINNRNSFNDDGESEGSGVELDSVTPDTPQSFDLDSATPDAPNEAPEADEPTEPAIPETNDDEAEAETEAKRQAEQDAKEKAEKEAKEKAEADKKAEEEKKKQEQENDSQNEKEAAAYKVYTDYVRKNVASLEGNSKWHPLDADKVIKLIDKWHEEYKHLNGGVVDREYMAAVLWQESKYDPNASSGVADGIGQFTKGTAKDRGLSDVWDPDESIKVSFEYYNFIYTKFDKYSDKYDWGKDIDTVSHKLEMALAGYNAGPNYRVFREGGFPDFRETNGYRAKIMGDYEKMKKAQKDILGDAKPNSGDSKKDDSEKEKKQFKAVGYSTALSGDQKLTYYNQRFDNGTESYAGGTFKDYGCGPSTLATIVSTLTGKDTSNLEIGRRLEKYGVVVPGNGTDRSIFNNPNFGLFDELNITVKKISISDKSFKEVIDNGGMVLMRQHGGVFASSNGRTYGHFMAVTGYNNNYSEWDDKNRKYYIADPNGNKGNSYTTSAEGYSFSTIKGGEGRARTGNLTNAWAVYVDGGKDAPKNASTVNHKKETKKTENKKQADTRNADTRKKKTTQHTVKTEQKPQEPKEITLDSITPSPDELKEVLLDTMTPSPETNEGTNLDNVTPSVEPEQQPEAPIEEPTETLITTPTPEQPSEPTPVATEPPVETVPEIQPAETAPTTLSEGETISLRNEAPTISPEAQKLIDEQLERARQVQNVIDQALQTAENAKK